MARFKLTIEYAGTRYRGWQVQKDVRTVQGELLRAAAAVCGGGVSELYGSGRTDAGVHALRQVAHLEVTRAMACEALRRGLNDELPADIHVLAVEGVPRRFHARHGAVGRSYLYQISTRRTAFGKPYVWWVKDELDVGEMREAARRFVGLHDFESFTEAEAREGETRVLIEAVEVVEAGALLLIRIRGSHFLWKLVRRLVGVIVEVGRGGLPAREVGKLLREASDLPARLTAPASGLFLERVLYEGDPPLGPPVPATPVSE